MAKFYALAETDIVGTMDLVPSPLGASAMGPNAFNVVSSASEYFIFNTNGGLTPASTLKSFLHLQWTAPFVAGTGEADQSWKADSGDSYLLSDLFALLITPGPTPGFTAATHQEVNQFFFKFEDAIHGSDEEDQLCGWAEDDLLWGGEGDDEFYYGEGMGKDKIMDFVAKRDELVLDDSIATKFNQIKGDVKFKKNGSAVINAGDGDKVILFGVDNLKELRKSVAFDDFTDFS